MISRNAWVAWCLLAVTLLGAGSLSAVPPPDAEQSEEDLERAVARRLVSLDERLDLATFPDSSPLWPARVAAALDRLAVSPPNGGELPARELLLYLAVELRLLGVDRGLDRPSESTGRASDTEDETRAARLRRILGTVEVVQDKLDRAEASAPRNRPAGRAAPSFDACGSAWPLGLVDSLSGSTTEATNDGTASCGDSNASPDIWFRFTAPATGSYVFDTFGSDFDTVLALWNECNLGGGEGQEIACSDDSGGEVQSKLAHSMEAGESVLVRVSGSSGATGSYSLSILEARGVAGTVISSATGDPLSGATIWAYRDPDDFAGSASTLADGSYFVSLSAGIHHLRARLPGFAGKFYDDIPCPFSDFACLADGVTEIEVGSEITEGVDLALDPAGSVSGRVFDRASLDGVDAFVSLYGSQGAYQTTTVTGADGSYELPGVPAGTYYLQTGASGYRGEVYDDVPCDVFCDVTIGTPILVEAGEVATRIDFALDRYQGLEGTVTAAVSGEPLEGAWVALYGSDGILPTSTWTSIDGTYRFESVRPGTYHVTSGFESFRNEVYDDVPCPPGCDVTSGAGIEVGLDADTTGIDFALLSLGRVAGRVTEAGSGDPLAGVNLSARNAIGDFVWGGHTEADGSYVIERLPEGSYYIITASETHQNEVYDGVVCGVFCDVSSGAPVETMDGSTTSGIDFELRRRGSIEGRVTHTVSGEPIAGVFLQAIDTDFSSLATAITTEDGTYEMDGMHTASYYLRAFDTRFADELYDDIDCEESCDMTTGQLVQVVPETVTSGIDFAIDRLGFLAGRITAADTGEPISTDLRVLRPNGQQAARMRASSEGDFLVEGLLPGSYLVRADTWSSAQEFQDELFDGVPCEPFCDLSLGTLVPVDLNGGAAGLSLTLTRCPADTYQVLIGASLTFDEVFEACERLSASDVVIGSGAEITFKAGRTIVLDDGFRVEDDASFRAIIEPAWSDQE